MQSPTFRILQRVTSRDEEIHSQPAIHHPPTVGQSFPVDQLRKMQLNNEDRNLMNRLKNQGNVYSHTLSRMIHKFKLFLPLGSINLSVSISAT